MKASEIELWESEEQFRLLFELASVGIGVSTLDGNVLSANKAMEEITGYSTEDFKVINLAKVYVSPGGRERMIEVVKRDGRAREFPVQLRRKDGSRCDVLLSTTRVHVHGRDLLYTTCEDITDLKQAEDEIRGLSRFPSENPSPVLRVAGDGKVLFVNKAGQDLISAWGCSVGGVMPAEWCEKVADVLRVGTHRISQTTCCEKTFSLTFAPVTDAGYVNIYGSDITEQTRLRRLAAEISEAERKKLCTDLHDTVCQQLVGAGFLADHLREDLAEYPGGVAERVDKICSLVRQSLNQISFLSREATPLSDAPHELVGALADLTFRIVGLYNVRCRMTSRKRIALRDGRISNQLLFIAQEAATNAARHAEASLIGLSLTRRGRSLQLRVRDNGKGLKKRKREGQGINIMHERANLIGAQLQIRQPTEGGTVVECTWKEEG